MGEMEEEEVVANVPVTSSIGFRQPKGPKTNQSCQRRAQRCGHPGRYALR
jgi:hypothetical protein